RRDPQLGPAAGLRDLRDGAGLLPDRPARPDAAGRHLRHRLLDDRLWRGADRPRLRPEAGRLPGGAVHRAVVALASAQRPLDRQLGMVIRRSRIGARVSGRASDAAGDPSRTWEGSWFEQRLPEPPRSGIRWSWPRSGTAPRTSSCAWL